MAQEAQDEPTTAPLDEECEHGMHSWIHAVGRLPADTPCTRCGETYGHPE